MKKKCFGALISLLSGISLYSQSFYKAEKTSVSPSQLMLENFTIIDLKLPFRQSASNGVIDKGNVYTYLQNVRDDAGGLFQVLYQTDFMGKMNAIALSNNMNELFQCNGKPSIGFDFCIRKVNENDFTEKQTEEIMNCILSRINSCKP